MSPDQNEVEQFGRLFEAHFDDLWSFARRRCGSAADADDLAGQVFAVAWRRRDDIPAADARWWFFGVARNVLANHRRSEARRDRLHIKLTWNHRDAVDDAGADDEPLRAAMRSLDADHREVLIMRFWDDVPVRDIATLLGCTPNAVSVRLHKARRALVAQLGQTDPDVAGQVPTDPQRRTEDRHGCE